MNDWLIGGIIVGICFIISLYYGHRTKRAAHSSIDKYKEHVKELSYVEIEEEKEEDEDDTQSSFSITHLISGLVTLGIIVFVGSQVFSAVGDANLQQNITGSPIGVAFEMTETMGSIWPLLVVLGVMAVVLSSFSMVSNDPVNKTTKTKTKKVIRKH